MHHDAGFRVRAPRANPGRRGSLAWPLVLIGAGTMALLVETGVCTYPQFLDGYARWWPALLVALGAVSLTEWWLDRGRAHQKVRYHAGLIAMIVLFALVANSRRMVGGYVYFGSVGDILKQIFGADHPLDFNPEKQFKQDRTEHFQSRDMGGIDVKSQ